MNNIVMRTGEQLLRAGIRVEMKIVAIGYTGFKGDSAPSAAGS
jgi:hypothetical protein